MLFNRFVQPDIDLDELEVAPHLVLSTSDELRLPLRWIAILHGRVAASLAATGGAHTRRRRGQAAARRRRLRDGRGSLLRKGPEHVRTLVHGVLAWLAEREYESVEQMKGSLQPAGLPRTRRLRARQLHEGAELLLERIRVGVTAQTGRGPPTNTPIRA